MRTVADPSGAGTPVVAGLGWPGPPSDPDHPSGSAAVSGRLGALGWPGSSAAAVSRETTPPAPSRLQTAADLAGSPERNDLDQAATHDASTPLADSIADELRVRARLGSVLFLLAGVMFLVAAMVGEQRAFYGVAGAFAGVAIATWRRGNG
ncbi:MAG: hypothetical protein ACRDPB_03540 [Nocardioidaceae bacterium]